MTSLIVSSTGSPRTNSGSLTSRNIPRLGFQAREGKVFCCAVMDTFSRKIVGWSIDSAQDTKLVMNALDMVIKNRQPAAGGIVHADH